MESTALKVLCYRVLSSKSYPKPVLNVAIAKYIAPQRVTQWENKAPIEIKIKLVNKTEHLFSFPEYCHRHKQLEPKIIDPSHLMVNNRSRLLEKGVRNLRPEAFVKICTTHPHVINRALVVDIIDKQSVSLALKVFSPEVVEALISNGSHNEAKYVKLIRNWYEAIDGPGIPAQDRIDKMIEFKSYLLEGVNFNEFPPPGMFVKNMPSVQFSGFIQNTDTRK